MEQQRERLTYLWWGWGLALIILMVILSYSSPVFGGDPSRAWGWLLPNITPTLLLVGAVAYQQKKSGIKKGAPPHPLFKLTLGASLVYLALLSIAVLSVLLTSDPMKTLEMSNLWLGPLQGLCASVLGVFFTGEAEKGDAPKANAPERGSPARG